MFIFSSFWFWRCGRRRVLQAGASSRLGHPDAGSGVSPPGGSTDRHQALRYPRNSRQRDIKLIAPRSFCCTGTSCLRLCFPRNKYFSDIARRPWGFSPKPLEGRKSSEPLRSCWMKRSLFRVGFARIASRTLNNNLLQKLEQTFFTTDAPCLILVIFLLRFPSFCNVT